MKNSFQLSKDKRIENMTISLNQQMAQHRQTLLVLKRSTDLIKKLRDDPSMETKEIGEINSEFEIITNYLKNFITGKPKEELNVV